MARLLGLALVVAGIWAMTEIYLKGTERAFGGLLASGSASEASADGDAGAPAPHPTLGLRVKDSVARARAQEDARTERLLGD